MGDAMTDDNKTKKQLIDELTELRSQNAALKESTAGGISAGLVIEEARRYAESIVETVREPLLVLGADLKVISANRSFYRTFKVTPAETIGSFIYDLGNKQWDIPKLRELLEEVLPEKEAFDGFEVAHSFQQIGYKVMLLNARQIYRKDIDTKMILFAIEDITEHKRLEDLLKEAEGHYRRVFETANDGIMLLEKGKGKITHANPAVERMLGYTKEESEGKTLQDIGVSLDMDDFQTTMQNLNEIGIIRYDNVPVITKSGQHIDTDIYLVDKARLVQCNIRDISPRKQMEDELRESEARLNFALEVNHTGVWDLNLLDHTAYRTLIHDRIFGYETLLPIWTYEMFLEHVLPEDRPEVDRRFREATASQSDWSFECRIRRTDGELRWIWAKGHHVQNSEGKFVQMLGIVQDITERKRAEEALRQSEEKYRDIFDKTVEGIYRTTPAGRFEILNSAFAGICGYASPEEMMEKVTDIANQLYANAEDRLRFQKLIAVEGEVKDFEVQFKHPTKGLIWISLNSKALRDEQGNIQYYDGSIKDITERKRAEEALERSEEKYRSLFDNAMEGVYQSTLEGRLISANMAFSRMFGYESPEEAVNTVTDIGRQMYANPDDRKRAVGIFKETGYIENFECQMRRKDGSIFWASFNGRLSKTPDGDTCLEGLITDITDRKKAEEEIHRSKQQIEMLVTSSSVMLYSCEAFGNFDATFISNNINVITGYTNNEFLSIGFWASHIHPEDTPKVFENLAMLFEHDNHKHEYRFMFKDGTYHWMYDELKLFRDGSGNPLEILGTWSDITERKRMEDELERTLERLKNAIHATIQVMVSAVEVRDPYTSGHQIRSAHLARVIAAEMGLPPNIIDGIRMAGSIHDIGKLSVPAEILSKPTKLTALEFSLIKEHSRGGYEMLKDVESPWPLAEIVYQHHERMDGSGYPRNLKGDDILMEARILAVSDVVESMASHRPYRPALGIEAALEEIGKNKGILYDVAVADTCLRLFREKGFQFAGA